MLVLYWSAHSTLFRLLSTVTRATTATLLNTRGVEATAHDGVLHADVLHATTAKHDHRMLLEVVTFTRNIRGNFHAVCKTNTSDFTDSRVRFARSLGGHFRAHATLEWGRVERRTVFQVVEATRKSEDFRLLGEWLAPFLRKLVDGRHVYSYCAQK